MMNTYIPNERLEKVTILKKYRVLRSSLKDTTSEESKKLFRKAFSLAVDAHKDMRRKSGEPYVYHPIAVAEIVAKEIKLGTTSMIAALLHDVVEDTDYTIEDIRDMFGEEVANIVYGLTKIDDIVMDENQSIQAENFRKILLYTVDDIRVILIKLADRLHNMRTLSSMIPEKQWKITSEDWRNREKWDAYTEVVNEMIIRTSTTNAPWVIVEANNKYYARIKVLESIVSVLEERMNIIKQQK